MSLDQNKTSRSRNNRSAFLDLVAFLDGFVDQHESVDRKPSNSTSRDSVESAHTVVCDCFSGEGKLVQDDEEPIGTEGRVIEVWTIDEKLLRILELADEAGDSGFIMAVASLLSDYSNRRMPSEDDRLIEWLKGCLLLSAEYLRISGGSRIADLSHFFEIYSSLIEINNYRYRYRTFKFIDYIERKIESRLVEKDLSEVKGIAGRQRQSLEIWNKGRNKLAAFGRALQRLYPARANLFYLLVRAWLPGLSDGKVLIEKMSSLGLGNRESSTRLLGMVADSNFASGDIVEALDCSSILIDAARRCRLESQGERHSERTALEAVFSTVIKRISLLSDELEGVRGAETLRQYLLKLATLIGLSIVIPDWRSSKKTMSLLLEKKMRAEELYDCIETWAPLVGMKDALEISSLLSRLACCSFVRQPDCREGNPCDYGEAVTLFGCSERIVLKAGETLRPGMLSLLSLSRQMGKEMGLAGYLSQIAHQYVAPESLSDGEGSDVHVNVQKLFGRFTSVRGGSRSEWAMELSSAMDAFRDCPTKERGYLFLAYSRVYVLVRLISDSLRVRWDKELTGNARRSIIDMRGKRGSALVNLLRHVGNGPSDELSELAKGIIEECTRVIRLGETDKGRRDVGLLYYSSIRNALYLFDDLYLVPWASRPLTGPEIDSEDNGDNAESVQGKRINCLTVMESNYMNDPTEGRVLLDALSERGDIMGESVENYRSETLTSGFVFMRSFTSLDDELNMWSLYGSSGIDGRQCDGCCIELDPTTFSEAEREEHSRAKAAGDSIVGKRLPWNDVDDECGVYKIAYLSRSQEVDSAAPEWKVVAIGEQANFVNDLLGELRTQVGCLSDVAVASTDKSLSDAIRRLVARQLRRILYLFKDSSYAREDEKRLILFRGTDEQSLESIRVLPAVDSQSPRRLCLNPPIQVRIKSITLGPNVVNAEEWVPDLQYRLSEMNNRLNQNGSSGCPVVKFSKIPIR